MTVTLNLPRAVTVPFTGAGILAHDALKAFAGMEMRLHAGINLVVDEVAQHPLLRRFIVDANRPQAPIRPEVPPGGAQVPAPPVAQHLGTERQAGPPAPPVGGDPHTAELTPRDPLLSVAGMANADLDDPDGAKQAAADRAAADAKANDDTKTPAKK